MNHTLTVRGAYSTDFKSKREILEHYNSNKDFQNLNITTSGAIVNKQDARMEIHNHLRAYLETIYK